jgi:uncharacterized SAM-binding protein YcdF (DUF218 family)
MTRAGVGLAVGVLIGSIVLDLNLLTLVPHTGGDDSFMLPALAAVAALLWLTPLRVLLKALAVGLAALWLVVAFTPAVASSKNGLIRRDALQAGDAAFVFSSRMQDDGDPTPSALARLLRGVEVVADGRAPRLIVSEISNDDEGGGKYEPLARAWLERVAPQAELLSFGPIRDTHEEAVGLARLFRERGWKRVLAVTSPTHTRRAAAALEKEGLEVIAVPAVEIDFDLERLEYPGDRRRAFGKIVHEWAGLLVYKRRGWID